jgi:hypothetical protein
LPAYVKNIGLPFRNLNKMCVLRKKGYKSIKWILKDKDGKDTDQRVNGKKDFSCSK